MTVGTLKTSNILIRPSPSLRNYIQNLPSYSVMPPGIFEVCTNDDDSCENFLTLHDLRWLHEQMLAGKSDVYIHELLEASEIVLPTNPKVPRDPILEDRCKMLRNRQDERKYRAMTGNLSSRNENPEDSIAFQLRQINSHLIAVAQVVISVLAGFAFGFVGMETFVGKMDLGVRLLSGILSAVVIALAELYFVLRKLSADC